MLIFPNNNMSVLPVNPVTTVVAAFGGFVWHPVKVFRQSVFIEHVERTITALVLIGD